jgi:hypothetical protein
LEGEAMNGAAAYGAKPRIRKRHGVWVCSSWSLGFPLNVMGHGYTPTEAWCDWALQMGRMAMT